MDDILIIDMQALLDESEVGRQAAAQLMAQWQAAEQEIAAAQHAEAGKADKGGGRKRLARLKQKQLAGVEEQRQALRSLLLQRAHPIIAQIAEARGASVVLEREAVILFKKGFDITAEVAAQVDAQGPLSLG